jgi:hypothetical protein
MENLYYDLSKAEFSRSKKILLWSFCGFFFSVGIYILVVGLVIGKASMTPELSLAPFGISVAVAAVASLATFKGTDLFFLIDDDKIEFRYGFIKPRKHLFKWDDIREIVMPARQRKAKLLLKDGSEYVINFTWIEGRKSSIIRKRLYHAARAKDLNVLRVSNLSNK